MPQLRGMAAILILTLVGTLLFSHLWHPAPPPESPGVTSAEVPQTLAGYRATADEIPSTYVRNALPGARIVEREYHQGNAMMDFLLISGTRGVELHDPRFCMGGLLLSAPSTVQVSGTPVRMQVYKASSHAGQVPDELVAFFYVDGRRIISDPSEIRMALFWSDLFGRTSAPVYFFRFIQPLTPNAHQNLLKFAGGAWQALQPHVYSAPA
jgi:hypothetical protein